MISQKGKGKGLLRNDVIFRGEGVYPQNNIAGGSSREPYILMITFFKK